MSNTDQPACPGLARGQTLPAFTLPGADGMPHSPWDYKQRSHLLLLFVQSSSTNETRDLLLTLAQRYSDLREEACALLAITADPVITNLHTQEALHLPFALLSDATAHIIPRYTRWDSQARTLTPALILADRYNTIQGLWSAEQPAEFSAILPDLFETLQYLNRLCTP